MGTKCNKLLQVSLAPDVSRSKIVEIPIPDCSRRRTPAPEHLENCGIHAISLSPSRCRIVSGGRLPCDSVVLEATPSGSYDFLGTFTVRRCGGALPWRCSRALRDGAPRFPSRPPCRLLTSAQRLAARPAGPLGLGFRPRLRDGERVRQR